MIGYRRVPASELAPGDVVALPAGTFHRADIGTVRSVMPSDYSGTASARVRVNLCGPVGWVECSGRHTLTVLNDDRRRVFSGTVGR